MTEDRKDRLPFISISEETTLVNKTGSWRTQKPIMMRRTSPCMANCLSGQDIPSWISAVKEGDFKKAYEIIKEDNPFPAITGRICPHPCESECNRRELDEAIAVNDLERFIGDWGLENVREVFPLTTKRGRVAVIGSGPAGLSCAYYLRKQGYWVTIVEAMSVIGGLLAYGIPEFRLAKAILRKELERKILTLGIKVVKGFRVDQLLFETLLYQFDAIFVAVGASRARQVDFPGSDTAGVLQGIQFLKEVNLGRIVNLGEKVIVVGGGNTAIDAARMARRLGSEVAIFYRRTRKEMPAGKDDVREAQKEGIRIVELVAPLRVIAVDGRMSKVEFQRMELGEADESGPVSTGMSQGGRRKPVPVAGEKYLANASSLIIAIGEEVDLSFLPKEKSYYLEQPMHEPKKVFFGGDADNQAGTVAAAIRSGAENAKIIDIYLSKKPLRRSRGVLQDKTIRYEAKELKQYFELQPRIRVDDSHYLGLARFEAGRCLSCGLCSHCDRCFDFCPDAAVLKGEKNEINYDYCKGCGICIQECPSKAIIFESSPLSGATEGKEDDDEGE